MDGLLTSRVRRKKNSRKYLEILQKVNAAVLHSGKKKEKEMRALKSKSNTEKKVLN